MSSPRKEALLAGCRVLLLWFSVYVGASMASTLVIIVSGHAGDDISNMPMWVIGLNLVAMWTVFMTVMPRLLPFEDRHPRFTFSTWFTARDFFVGVPLGIFGQIVLANVVNWPLSRLFPDTFSFEEVSQRAEDISSAAPGAWKFVLVILVVVGAPIVEEIVYRGSVQTQLVTVVGRWSGVFITAALFALIHLSPVEFPALFAFAVLLGLIRQWSGTLGAPIITHMAFNATGLLLVTLF